MNTVAVLPLQPDITWLPKEIQELIESREESPYYDMYAFDAEKVSFFGEATGDFNPIHFHNEVAEKLKLKCRIAHGDLVLGALPAMLKPLFDAFLREGIYPVYKAGTFTFGIRPVYVGEAMRACVRMTNISGNHRGVTLDYEFKIVNLEGKQIAKGTKQILCQRPKSSS